jgi:hypothetical protein
MLGMMMAIVSRLIVINNLNRKEIKMSISHDHDKALSDLVGKLRNIQRQRHKLTLKRTKTDRDFDRIDKFYDQEDQLYGAIQMIDPDYFRDK